MASPGTVTCAWLDMLVFEPVVADSWPVALRNSSECFLLEYSCCIVRKRSVTDCFQSRDQGCYPTSHSGRPLRGPTSRDCPFVAVQKVATRLQPLRAMARTIRSQSLQDSQVSPWRHYCRREMSSRRAGCQWEPRLPTLESRVVCEEDEVCVSRYKLCLWYVRRGM